MSKQQPSEIVARYLKCLDRSQFERAADQFSQTAIYYSPLVGSDGGVISGRDDLLKYFRNRRSDPGNAGCHYIVNSVDGEDQCAVFGIRAGDPALPFVSYAEVGHGKKSAYAPGLLQEGYWTEFLEGTDTTPD